MPENRPEQDSGLDRRQFIRVAGLAGLGMIIAACTESKPGAQTPEGGKATGPTVTPVGGREGSTAGLPGIDVDINTPKNYPIAHPDMDGKMIDVRVPGGFTPDKRLVVAQSPKALALPADLKQFSDWEVALNTKRKGGALAGYDHQQNDWCPTVDFKCNAQSNMYSWSVYQGMYVELPGIGRLVGGPRRSVVALVLNLDGSVFPWDKLNKDYGQTTQVRGFRATGRIFDGEKNVDQLEQGLAGHWLFRQFNGTPEKSYIGITDSPDNAQETLLVSAIRRQWGNNPDGSKRMQFQLMRAEVVKR